MDRDTSSYSSSYLHRKYISENPIIQSSPAVDSGHKNIKNMIKKEADSLKDKENGYLISLATALTGNPKSTTEDGMIILQELRTSAESVNAIITESMFDIYEESGQSSVLEEVQEQMVKAIKKNINSADVKDDLGIYRKNYSDSINEIANKAAKAKTTGQRYINTIASTQGTRMEAIMANIIKKKWTKLHREKNIGKKLLNIKVEQIGKKDGGTTFIDTDSVQDIKITIGKEDFKFSQKTKLTNHKMFGVLKGKSLEGLLKESGDTAHSEFIKFGLINQHYWGNEVYQKKAINAWGSEGIPGEIDPRGTSSTGIESLSYSGTMKVFHPIIDIMYNSFAINLYIGFIKDDPNLFTVVVGNKKALWNDQKQKKVIKTKGIDGTIVRSSDSLYNLADTLSGGKRNLDYRSSFKADTSIMEDAWDSKYRNSDIWASQIEGKFDDILSKTMIMTTYNYGKMK